MFINASNFNITTEHHFHPPPLLIGQAVSKPLARSHFEAHPHLPKPKWLQKQLRREAAGVQALAQGVVVPVGQGAGGGAAGPAGPAAVAGVRPLFRG